MDDPGRMFQARKSGAGGLLFAAIGVWMVVNPDIGLPPGRRTLDD